MKKFFALVLVTLTLTSCERQNKASNLNAAGDYDNSNRNTHYRDSRNYESDNTGKNIRDRDARSTTSFDQYENESDRTITQKVRQALVYDNNLSMNAKNIKIITMNGVVTLRGPVASSQEKDLIARKVNEVDGVMRVDNQLEVTRNNP